jgi:hypothetical protein
LKDPKTTLSGVPHPHSATARMRSILAMRMSGPTLACNDG